MGFKTGRLDVFIFTITERFLVESLVDESINHRNDVMGAQFLFLSLGRFSPRRTLNGQCESVYLGVVALRECEVFNVFQGCVSSAIVLFIVKSWLRCVK